MRKLVPTLLLLSSACFADTVVNIVFTNLPSTNYNNTYNGFTTATVGTNSSGVGGVPGQLLICDDEAHNTNVPSGALPYDFSTINTASSTIANARFTPGSSSPVYFGGETQTQLYEEAAIILYNFTKLISPTAETIAQYQYALWNLMNSTQGLFGNPDPNKNTDNSAASTVLLTAQRELLLENTSTGVLLSGSAKTTQMNLDSTIYGELRIYTPTATDASNQEWLQLVPCPEPVTAGAAGLLLFGMGFVAYRRRKLQANANA